MGLHALSRARGGIHLHVISKDAAHDQDRRQYGRRPVDPAPAETIAALYRAMTRSETEPLAVEHHHEALIQALGHRALPQLEHPLSVGWLPPRSPTPTIRSGAPPSTRATAPLQRPQPPHHLRPNDSARASIFWVMETAQSGQEQERRPVRSAS